VCLLIYKFADREKDMDVAVANPGDGTARKRLKAVEPTLTLEHLALQRHWKTIRWYAKGSTSAGVMPLATLYRTMLAIAVDVEVILASVSPQHIHKATLSSWRVARAVARSQASAVSSGCKVYMTRSAGWP